MQDKILEDTNEKVEMRVVIELFDFLDGCYKEQLEDRLKQCLYEYGVRARIKSSTGNEMTVNLE